MRIHIRYSTKPSETKDCRMFSVYSDEVVVHYQDKPQENLSMQNVVCITALEDEVDEKEFAIYRMIYSLCKLTNWEPVKAIELLKAQKAIPEDYRLESFLKFWLYERERKR